VVGVATPEALTIEPVLSIAQYCASRGLRAVPNLSFLYRVARGPPLQPDRLASRSAEPCQRYKSW
jgi:hypothetical protein